jgi:hypothetical protein
MERLFVRCPLCGHKMEVEPLNAETRGKNCDKCHADFWFSNEELEVVKDA